jgi:hypothetical protein
LVLSFGAVILSLGLAEGLIRIVAPERALPRYGVIPSRSYHHINPPNREMFFGLVGTPGRNSVVTAIESPTWETRLHLDGEFLKKAVYRPGSKQS